jgi:hypothetical protein
MTVPRFFTDEDVYGAVVPALRRAGIDAVSTREAGRQGLDDASQLEWVSTEGRVLVTFNVAHFADLHAKWLQHGRHHAGIVVSSQRPIGDILRRLLRLAKAVDAESMRDRLEFLGDW